MAIVVVMVGKEERESLEVVVVYGRIKWSHEIRGIGAWESGLNQQTRCVTWTRFALASSIARIRLASFHEGHSQDGVDPLFSFTLRG